MKLIISITSLLIFAISGVSISLAQDKVSPTYKVLCDTINYKDGNGKKQGTWKRYRKDGTLKGIQHYKDNKLTESAMWYYASGVKSEEQHYENG
ncbi:MAG: hypothetical protein JKY33_00320, partial [Bacteroidia bacterium]|nr:hypothetical protein [Bacteroidia bacterium]